MPQQTLYEGRFLRLIRDGHWEYAERTNASAAVVIIAVTDDDKLLLTEQFRIPLGKAVIELPAGLVGDTPGEDAADRLAAARRELLEETGYEADEMTPLTEGPVSAGFSNEVITIVRASGLRRTATGGGVEHEDIRVHEVSLTSVEAWLGEAAARGFAVDPKVYLALFFTGRASTAPTSYSR